MKYVTPPETQIRAKRLRRDMNEPERVLWMILRDRRLTSAKFRRQVPIGGYVVDFVCFAEKLIIELDGSQHAKGEQAAFDARRTANLESAGFRVLRIWIADLERDREGVLAAIMQALSPSPLVGEGGREAAGG